MKLEDVVLREIGALTRTIHAIIEIKFKTLNLQKGQSIYLTRICENPGLSMKELSQLLMVDKTTTSKVVHKLITEELVSKTQDAHDKRAYNLFPTEKAKQAYDFIIEEENRLTAQCYSGFNISEQKAVLALIQKMRQNIEDDWFELKRYR
ncbi:MarR family winged helix-turn-helix transcriptional regulator [Desulfosediminicola flagellatus]|uniref:MarR family winged helix-turn-helix transcriptional regulator n=1 Tax=Desulfosediminicola flagellatus TaxID=2569541 RepID=UPI0010AB96D0|nr:MarR family transcriptional regulator [Desulfosediminicola flagellatus]